MKFNYKKDPAATTRAWIQLLTPPPFICHTCGRGSDTEEEHLFHICDPFRVWVIHTWRRIKAYVGLWSWAPRLLDNYGGNLYNDGQNTAVVVPESCSTTCAAGLLHEPLKELPPFEECGPCRENDPTTPHYEDCQFRPGGQDSE